MKHIINLLVFICLLSGMERTWASSNCYFKLNDMETSSPAETRKLLESYGGRIIHEFPQTNEFICDMAPSQYTLFAKRHALAAEHTEADYSVDRAGSKAGIGRFCFDQIVNESSPQQGLELPEGVDLIRDCGIGVHETSKAAREAMAAHINSVSRNEMFNANYLVGKTAVCIVLPESSGDTENWTVAEEDIAIAQVVQAYETLSGLAYERNIDVTWVYEIHRSVPVSEEPIQHVRPYFTLPPFVWSFGWMNDALDYLDAGSDWMALFRNANRLRRQYKTDWGLTYFLVKNTTEDSFPDNSLGYTRQYWMTGATETFRAPFAVSVLYRTPGNPYTAHKTIAHETLHIFGAPDEYAGAFDCGQQWTGIPLPPADCNHGHGFLAHHNLNCVNCTSEQDSCIMITSAQAYYLCDHTLRHIGWSDSDGDGQPDAIDPNNDRMGILNYVAPGDLVRILTIAGATVRVISVTENKYNSDYSTDFAYWDASNYQSQKVDPDVYYYVVNDDDPRIVTFYYDITPANSYVHDISYANGTLTWELSPWMAYVEAEIWGVDPCSESGDTVLLGRPLWNKLYGQSAASPNKTLDVSNFYCTPCIAKFHSWAPEGSVGPVVEFEFTPPEAGDWDEDGKADLCDNCPWNYNPAQEDTDADGIGDSCDCEPGEEEEWDRLYTWAEELRAFTIEETFDGNYLVAGVLRNPPYLGGSYHHYLTKLRPCGEIMWHREYQGSLNAHYCTARQTADSGFIVMGRLWTGPIQTLSIMKTNSDGDSLWARSFEPCGWCGDLWPRDILPTEDGGFLLLGQLYGPQDKSWITKTDSLGDSLWTRTYASDPTCRDYLQAAVETPDGGFVLLSQSTSGLLAEAHVPGQDRLSGGHDLDSQTSDEQHLYLSEGYSADFG